MPCRTSVLIAFRNIDKVLAYQINPVHGCRGKHNLAPIEILRSWYEYGVFE